MIVTPNSLATQSIAALLQTFDRSLDAQTDKRGDRHQSTGNVPYSLTMHFGLTFVTAVAVGVKAAAPQRPSHTTSVPRLETHRGDLQVPDDGKPKPPPQVPEPTTTTLHTPAPSPDLQISNATFCSTHHPALASAIHDLCHAAHGLTIGNNWHTAS